MNKINLRKESNQSFFQKHEYHLVDPSPWPIISAGTVFTLAVGAAMYMHRYTGGGYVLILGLIGVVLSMAFWFRDIVREATFEGHHTAKVQKLLRSGMVLFIVSEVCFFVAFFWAYFHSALAPTVEIGSIWPPMGIEVLNAFEVPFLNTIILLLSGLTVTWAHHAIVGGNRKEAISGLIFTIALGVIFTLLQLFEYYDASFKISDGVYGSTFYMATGFHGFHVFVGTTFLAVCLVRLVRYHFTKEHHFGFEAAAWYWHFVDVVWLFLFVSVYWWGGK